MRNNISYNSNIIQASKTNSSKMIKKVRFSSIEKINNENDDLKLSFLNKPILTNTYKGELCSKCGSIRFGKSIELGCKNCLIPKPSASTTTNQKLKLSNKSKFLSSRSLENLSNSKNNFQGTQEEKEEETYSHYLNDSKLVIEKNRLNTNQIMISNSYKLNQPEIKPRNTKTIAKKQENDSFSKSTKWRCYNCDGEFKPGQLAIIAEHVGEPNARWHKHCFRCSQCDQRLNDLLYFSFNRRIYCEYDYLNLMKMINESKKCPACQKPIESAEYIEAEDTLWHCDCFICWDCEESLADKKYVLSNDKPYCIKCHEAKFVKKCNTCKKHIETHVERFTYENLNWHAASECFKCHACENNLLETHFLLKNNLLFCSIDCKNKIITSFTKHKNNGKGGTKKNSSSKHAVRKSTNKNNYINYKEI